MRRWLLGIMVVFTVGLFASGAYLTHIAGQMNTVPVEEGQPIERQTLRNQEMAKESLEPISFLILGLDSGELFNRDESDASYVARSDVMMLAVLDLQTEETTLISLPRDAYVPIDGEYDLWGETLYDKLNHAVTYGGIYGAVNTVQYFLDFPVDHFVAINMDGLKYATDAIGGIDVVPNETFEQSSFEFYEGVPHHLNGNRMVAYVRNRDGALGDYGRQYRQRQVIELLINKFLSKEGLIHTPELLSVAKEYVKTDVTIQDGFKLLERYKPAFNTIETLQLSGEGLMIEDIYYEVIDRNSYLVTQRQLRSKLGLTPALTDRFDEIYHEYWWHPEMLESEASLEWSSFPQERALDGLIEDDVNNKEEEEEMIEVIDLSRGGEYE